MRQTLMQGMISAVLLLLPTLPVNSLEDISAPENLPRGTIQCEQVGAIPDDESDSCATYYMCAVNPDNVLSPVFAQCPGSTVFSRVLRQCVDPSTYACDGTARRKREAEFQCTEDGRFPNVDSTDCKTYYLCTKNTDGSLIAALVACPTSTIFSAEKKSCVSSPPNVCPYAPITTTVEPQSSSTLAEPGDTFVCPSQGRFVNEQSPDCNTYYLCLVISNQLVPQLAACAAGSVFSAIELKCVTEDSYTCPKLTAPTVRPPTVTTPVMTTLEATTPGATSEVTTNIPITITPPSSTISTTEAQTTEGTTNIPITITPPSSTISTTEAQTTEGTTNIPITITPPSSTISTTEAQTTEVTTNIPITITPPSSTISTTEAQTTEGTTNIPITITPPSSTGSSTFTTIQDDTTTSEITTESPTSTPEVTETSEVTSTGSSSVTTTEVEITSEISTESPTSTSEVTETSEVTSTGSSTVTTTEVEITSEISTESPTSTSEVTETSEVTSTIPITITPDSGSSTVTTTEDEITTSELTTESPTSTSEVTETSEVTSTGSVTTTEVEITSEITTEMPTSTTDVTLTTAVGETSTMPSSTTTEDPETPPPIQLTTSTKSPPTMSSTITLPATTTISSGDGGTTLTPGMTTPGMFQCVAEGRYADPNSFDCVSYILCVKNSLGTLTPIQFLCPPTTIFSDTVGYCVSASAYSCKYDTSSIAPPTTISPTSTTTVKPTPTPFVCPNTGRYPNPDSIFCKSYYLCLYDGKLNLISVELSCPGGSIFATDEMKCASAEEYQCVKGTATTVAVSSTTTTTAVPTTTSTTTTSLAGTCTMAGKFPNSLRNDCSSYQFCVTVASGELVEVILQCPGNTLYDEDKKTCSDKYVCTRGMN
ncbi:mucin-2-like isoform X5 [Anopheles funestus]|uniref:mucin-2-like isoform X5 n=1 Tax=Anopheles funestus TaxID=62324 RepID=UPI0020C64C23|nr:mucin-2-like isoform X5 [Anopheles funestus]